MKIWNRWWRRVGQSALLQNIVALFILLLLTALIVIGIYAVAEWVQSLQS